MAKNNRDEAKSVRKKVKQMEVVVADVIKETADTVTLVFFTGNEELNYRPGHFLTIDPHQFSALDRFTRYLEDQKGKKEPPRAYSLASSPHEKNLAITVKEEVYITDTTRYPPLLSPFLVGRTPRGTRMVVTGFTGPYTLPPDIEGRTGHLIHVCAGSGIVPNYSMLKYALANHPALKHTFIYTNKTWDDVIYRHALRDLEGEHPGKLRVIHNLTRETYGSLFGRDVRKGRITETLLKEAVGDDGDAHFFLCGPGITPFDRARAKQNGQEPTPRFMETALTHLEALGVPRKRIHRESYG